MEGILPGFDANEPTWFYLSLPLLVAVFFRFTRVWSLRNLDLLLLLSLAPGLLLVGEYPIFGYGWLFALSAILVVRLFCDSLLTRRPLLESNLNSPGLVCLGVSVFVFLGAIIVTGEPSVETVRRGQQMLAGEDQPAGPGENSGGPATSLMAAPAVGIAKVASSQSNAQPDSGLVDIIAARILAFTAHLLVIGALFYIGFRHFGNWRIGLAMAVLYLLLPCTAYEVTKVNHVLPAAMVAWALAFYERPMIAGGLMGLACGTLIFPVFLLPLWAMFYGRRGALRFTAALAIVGAVLLSLIAVTSRSPDSFAHRTFWSIDWSVLMPSFHGGEAGGFWSSHEHSYRIPVYVSFLIMLAVLTIWPRKKNFEHLAAHSTAIIVGIQFWYPQQGGVYLLWYLPLLLIVVHRPRLTHLQPPDLDTPGAKGNHERPAHQRPGPRTVTSIPAGSRLFR